jgi:integrase
MQEGFSQSRKLVKTSTPGIYKRGSRYVVRFRDGAGRSRKRSARTLAEARDVKASVTADVKRGEYRTVSRVTFAEYARDWIESYPGRTTRGIREETRSDYRKALERHAIPVLGRMRMSAIETGDLDVLASRVAATGVSPGTVRLALAPVKALLADALQRGDIRINPASGYRTRHTQKADVAYEGSGVAGDDSDVKALAEDELARLLAEIPEAHRPFFEFLAQTGLRIGEAVEVRWGDLDLGGRWLHVRRRFYRGRVGPPKSRYGRRRIRLSSALAQSLWIRWAERRPADDDLVFTSEQGSRIDQTNLTRRILKPAAVRAGLGEWVKTPKGRRPVSWVGFHTFRHTCATLLFRNGWNAKQVQVFLGHHKPSFTLDTYVHLLDEDMPEPVFFDVLVGGHSGATGSTENDRDREVEVPPETGIVPGTARTAEIAASHS